MSRHNDMETLEGLLCDLQRLRKAHDLLERIWGCMDSYSLQLDLDRDHLRHIEGNRHLRTELHEFFGFDDSE